MVEHRCSSTGASRHVTRCLIVEPRVREPQLGCNFPRSLEDPSIGDEQRIDIAGCGARVEGQHHRRSAEDVDFTNDSLACEPIGEQGEGAAEHLAVEQWFVHAANRSRRSIMTPRRRNDAGA